MTTPLDGPARQHLDRIVSEVIASRDFETAALRLLVAADYGDMIEGVR